MDKNNDKIIGASQRGLAKPKMIFRKEMCLQLDLLMQIKLSSLEGINSFSYNNEMLFFTLHKLSGATTQNCILVLEYH